MRRWGLSLLLAACALAGAFWFGREVGGFEQAARVRALDEQLSLIEERSRQADRLRAEAEQRLVVEEIRAAASVAELEARVPQGELEILVDLLRARMDQGVPPERLRFVVEQAQRERRCRDGIIQRRLAPRLPEEVTPLQTIAFLDNRITVSATATAAIAENGAPEPWFDPSQPVQIRVLRIGGGIELVEGVLPLGHSVVADGREHRFGFASSAKKGLIELALQDCAYP